MPSWRRLRDSAIGIAFSALAALRRRRMPGPDGTRDASSPRILILAFECQLGSAMMATPIFRALREARPAARITVLCPPLLAEILCRNPHVDLVVETAGLHEPVISGSARHLARFFAGILPRLGRHDWLLTSVGCRRTLVSLLALSLPAGRICGQAPPNLLRFFDVPVSYDAGTSTAVNNLRILAPFGVMAAPREPDLYFEARHLDHAEALLAEGGIDLHRPIAIYAPQTSGGQPTDWYPERMAAMADRLHASHGLQPVFVGTGEGAEVIGAIRRRMLSPGLSLAGRTNILELGAVFALADLAVSLDTGAMHVARAVRVPLLVIASRWQAPHHWLPLDVETCSILSAEAIECAGCLKPSCATRECMDAISAEAAAAAARSLLRRHPPMLEARRARQVACMPRRKR